MMAKEDKAPELYPLLMMVNDRLELFIAIQRFVQRHEPLKVCNVLFVDFQHEK